MDESRSFASPQPKIVNYESSEGEQSVRDTSPVQGSFANDSTSESEHDVYVSSAEPHLEIVPEYSSDFSSSLSPSYSASSDSSSTSSDPSVVELERNLSDVEQILDNETTPQLNQVQQSLSLPLSSQEDQQSQRPCKKQRTNSTAYALTVAQMPSKVSKILSDAANFFTKTLNLERLGPPISEATFSKVKERICCYLGYLHSERNMPLVSLGDSVFQNSSCIEGYLIYLTDSRKLNPSTVSNHVGGILYMLKYLNRSSAPLYSDVPLINQLRKTATHLQKQGDLERPTTTHELKAVNRWLDWEQIVGCMTMQRQKFEMAKGLSKARECMDLVLLAMYCELPPARALEIRTLRICRESPQQQFNARDFTGKNVLLLNSSGSLTLHFQDYKTKKYFGHDQVTVEEGSELTRIIREYLKTYRAQLCHTTDDQNCVFLASSGAPFSGPAFTKHLKRVFFKLTGVEISVNGLRSSFVTYAYSQRNCSDSLKTSLALALRHSREQAQKTYDKRTSAEKKDEAVAFARQCSETISQSEVNREEPPPRPSKEREFQPGQFVALVEERSTLKEPKLLVGRVQHYVSDIDVSLLWYKQTNSNRYSLEFDGSPWIESTHSLHAVKMTQAKNNSGQYLLSTSARTIHKAVKGM